MVEAGSFDTEHLDFIHDVSYDYYGKRIATCSSDRTVKIWEKGDTGEWEKMAELNAHDGAVWKVVWANPEFGSIIATCSFDKTVQIWEEKKIMKNHKEFSSSWHPRARLLESRASVEDIKFAPRHLQLQLAACSKDGKLRIYEAHDVMNLSQWSTTAELQVSTSAGCNCASWNECITDPPMLIIGCDLASQVGMSENGPVADASSNTDNLLQIWTYKDHLKKWELSKKLTHDLGHTDSINDVAWAPNWGRTFHMIASCSRDKKIILWKLFIENPEKSDQDIQIEYEPITILNDHMAEVWRLSWNIMGTQFCSSGEDNVVRVWRPKPDNKNWVCTGEIKSDA